MPSDAEHPDALGILELSSIARAYRVLDDMVKRSPVSVRSARAVSRGKFLIFIQGDVAEVEEAMEAGIKAAEGVLLGELFLSGCHSLLWEALDGQLSVLPIDSLGIIESHSITDIVNAADIALKTTDVSIGALHLAEGIGGKGYLAIAGVQHDVEASLEAATLGMRPDLIVSQELICRPHDQMTVALLGLDTIHDLY